MRRRPLALLIAMGVAVTIVGSAHSYFISRLIVAAALPPALELMGRALIIGLGCLLFIHPIAERTVGRGIGRWLAWPAYTWLGACLYLLLGLWASDTVLFVAGLSGVDVDRNRAIAVGGFGALMVAFGLYSALGTPRVNRVEVALAGWPEALNGYRIVQISDVHIGSILRRGFMGRVVERINALAPDAVAITGDLVDGSVRALGPEVAPLGTLQARDGAFFVTGNHDHYSGADSWVAHLQSLGLVALRNRRVTIERDGARFQLAGVDDLSTRRAVESSGGFSLDAALQGWNEVEPLVLLAHDPRTFELARVRHVSLQLSGHTHDGQLWPFWIMVRLQTRWLAGLYRSGRSAIFVSRGTGFWGPPMRILAPAEITELVLCGPK